MVLITGATGLVGSHVALRLLENGTPVRALYRNEQHIRKTRNLFRLYGKESLADGIEWIAADITDVPALEAAFENIDQVYHCAAAISFNGKDEEKLRKTNIEGTANIVNLCLAHGVRKMGYVSSIAALGDLKEHETGVTETTEWNPEKHHSDYAISKYGAEMELWRGQQEGLSVVIINPGVILGPGFWEQGSSEIFAAIQKGMPFYTNGITAFVAVTDVVEIFIRLMDSGIEGERFTVIAQNAQLKDVLFNIANALHTKRPSIAAQRWATSLAWRTDWLLNLLFMKKREFFKDTARALHSTHTYSNEKIKTALDFEFTDIPSYIKEVVRLQKGK